MKKLRTPRCQVVALGKRLGLDAEQILSLLDTNQQSSEHPSLALGPPHYGGSFYGTIGINDFDLPKRKK